MEILTEGNNMSDAIEMARDAIELKCVSLEDEFIQLGKVTFRRTVLVSIFRRYSAESTSKREITVCPSLAKVH